MKIKQEADGSITVKCGEQEINIFVDALTPAEGGRSLGGSGPTTKPAITEPPQPSPEKTPTTDPEPPRRPTRTRPTHVAYRITIFGELVPFTSGTVAGATQEYDVTELLKTQAQASDGSVTLFIDAYPTAPAQGLTELQAAIAREHSHLTRR